MRILSSRTCKQAIPVYVTIHSHHLPVVNNRDSVPQKFEQDKHAVLDNELKPVCENYALYTVMYFYIYTYV